MDSIDGLPSFIFDKSAENSTLSHSSSSQSSGSPPMTSSLFSDTPTRPSQLQLFGTQFYSSNSLTSTPTEALSSLLDTFSSPIKENTESQLTIGQLTGSPYQIMTNRLASTNRVRGFGPSMTSPGLEAASPLGAPGTPVNGFASSPMCMVGGQTQPTGQTPPPKNPKLYKTELCRSWMEHGRCNYGERCQYAHGEIEKRAIPRHPKYKTEACQSFHQTGYCPYGPRCHFIHSEAEHLQQLQAAGASPAAAAAFSANLFSTTSGRSASVNGMNMGPGGPAMTPGAPNQHLHHNQLLQRMSSAPSYGSAGESPDGSSADSGSESPNGSYSPALDDDCGPFTVGFLTPQPMQRRQVQRFHSVYDQKTEPITGLLNDLMAFKFDEKWADEATSRLPVFAQLSSNQ